jgi:hypothetical protein
VRDIFTQQLVVIAHSRVSGTSITGGPMAEPPEGSTRTSVEIDRSTVKDTEVAGNSEVKVKASKVEGLRVGEPQAFLGIPVKIWIGTAGGMGLIGLLAYLVKVLLSDAGPKP